MLQCVTVCCSVLQCVAVYCSVLQCVAECCSALQCIAACCSVLQCVAICKTAASRKQKIERGIRTGNATKAACLAMGQDDCHSHACILPECGMFCTHEVMPSRTSRPKTAIRFSHLCRVAQKQIYGLSKHMCRKCHRTAAQCKAAVCTDITFSRPQKFCEHLHAQ